MLSSTPLKSKNEKFKQRNSTSFHNPVNIPLKNNPKDKFISSKKPIDAFIDKLNEGEESIIQDVSKVLPTSLSMQRDFGTRETMCAHKISFSDSVRMNRLLSVLDGEAKTAVSALGQDELFYASQLKLLKREFSNPLMVSYFKRKLVWSYHQFSMTVEMV